jgi:hypothetical protein
LLSKSLIMEMPNNNTIQCPTKKFKIYGVLKYMNM